MLSHFEWMVAKRYLRARREEGLISVIALFSLIGIALGVATLIVVLSVMNGVRAEMIKSIIGLEGHISIYSINPGGINAYKELSETVKRVPSVTSAVPKIEGQVMASFHGQATGAMASAYRSDDLKQKELLIKRIVSGDVAALERGDGIIIGQRMAEKLGLHLGDALMLISPEGRATVAGLVPRVKSYPVVGMFSIGMFAYDNGMVLMPFADAQAYFKLGTRGEGRRVNIDNAASSTLDSGSLPLDKASSIEIMVDQPEAAAHIAQTIASSIGPGFRIYDWKSSNNHIFQAVLVQRNVMFLILMLIIVVASFNIISSLIMLVREKGRDVAVLRTMGASRGSVMRIFMACGSCVGLAGTGFGVVFGLLIAFNTERIQLWLERMMGHKLFADELYFLSHLPSKVDGSEVVTVVVMALGLAFLATIYPARRAARLDPAEALRYE